MRCRLCDSARLSSVLDLGATPPCEKFLAVDELDLPEPTYPLHLRLCEDCLLLQIPALITPEETFTEYAYFASYSESWVRHAERFVSHAVERLGLGPESFVVEAASNDGYLLRHVVAAGIRCLGVEPSVNVGAAARALGVPTETQFLDEDSAAKVRALHGPAHLVVANNVYAHVPDLRGFTRALRELMADDGWLTIEVHHAANLVRLGQFDTIYHEHFQYYTVLSAQRALATAGLTVVDVELLATHGGSIRLWARPEAAAGAPAERVAAVLRDEAAAGLHDPDGYRDLAPRAAHVRHELLRYLLARRAEGKRVVGYGAPGKGNTLLNYCGIRPDLLEYTVDRNPYKHGRFTPGTRIPIHPPERIDADRPDVVLVLPWNLETELTAQLRHIADWGGELVYPLPTVHRADLTGAARNDDADPSTAAGSTAPTDNDFEHFTGRDAR
ncbi:methyltransferase domain-containing protein [Nocardia xishanensis]